MHTLVVERRHLARAGVDARVDSVDERRLAHARVTTEQSSLARKQFFESVDTNS